MACAMSMNIDALKLTDEEMEIAGRQTIPVLSSSQWPSIMARVAADAATAKALYGIADWLRARIEALDFEWYEDRFLRSQVIEPIEEVLTAAGLARPEGE